MHLPFHSQAPKPTYPNPPTQTLTLTQVSIDTCKRIQLRLKSGEYGGKEIKTTPASSHNSCRISDLRSSKRIHPCMTTLGITTASSSTVIQSYRFISRLIPPGDETANKDSEAIYQFGTK
jgi:hypothetical protein